MLDPVEPAAVHELVLDRIRRAIHLGVYAPGDRLPPERELADRLHVSRVTVREAMQVLEAKGYVKSRRGIKGGWFVISMESAIEDLRRRAHQSVPALHDILDFRLAVESAAARLAAQRRTDGDLDTMRAAIEEMREHPSLPGFRRADSAFHLAIADAARNTMLRESIEEARVTMFLIPDALGVDILLDTSLREHADILQAIAARDPSGAERAAVKHIESTRQELHHDLPGLEPGVPSGSRAGDGS
jgi:DNA-binding FadR family transcriptional regulator